ncbi:MAG: peptidoglycan bridge formation glycyltransferase FemA/FemB family protein [Eubacteriales bacterium]|nr:peptidoglycan bridge formation glycyltransferase FemA/FemB family protein [Eubacteriales bacterium]MDY3332203.1 peptidoglycan bridge formation glycyltransferase FemA/FemB family protein [Gallibacter sp.]
MEFLKLSREEYHEFEKNHPLREFMNAVEAYDAKILNGWDAEFVGVKEDGEVLAAALLTSIPVFKIFRYFYAQRGLLLDFKDEKLLKFFTSELKKYCKSKKGLYLVTDPAIMHKEMDIEGKLIPNGYDNSYIIDLMKNNGWEHNENTPGYGGAAYIRYIFSLYINNRSKEEVLKSFHTRTKRSITKTVKNSIAVRELSLDEIEIFLQMMDETADRRSFDKKTHASFKNIVKAYGNHGKLLLAYLDVEVFKENLIKEKANLLNELANTEKRIAQIPDSEKLKKRYATTIESIKSIDDKLVEADNLKTEYGNIINMATSFFTIYDNEIVYVYGGTNDNFRKYFAPYALQWHMICHAVDNNINKYNFYGISGIFDKNANDYGVYEFKRGFSGVVEKYIGDFTLPIRPLAYKLYRHLKR